MRLVLRWQEKERSWHQDSSEGDRLLAQSCCAGLRFDTDVWQCKGIPVDAPNLYTQLKSISEASTDLLNVSRSLAGAIWGSSLCIITDKKTDDRLILPDVAHTVRLFYRQSANNIVLDTDLANLVLSQEVEWNINFLVSFATTQFGVSGQTPFLGINVVPPGCALQMSTSGAVTIKKIWPFKNDTISFPTAVERVYSHLGKTIPDFALALSGGVDSSSSAIFIRRAIGPDVPLRGIHFYTSMSPDYNEKDFAKKIASAIRADLIPIDIESSLPFSCTQTDSPPIVLSQEMMFIATNHAIQIELGREVTILEGEGGDLLFHAIPDVDVIEDAFLQEGLRSALKTASKLAHLYNGSIPRIILQAIFRRIHHRFPLCKRERMIGITDEIFDYHRIPAPLVNLQLRGRSSSLDRLVQSLDSFLEVTDPAGDHGVKRINPFLAPPIVGAALALESHKSFSEENDRIVLRELASRFCSTDVIWRRTKGSFDAGILRGLQVNQEQYLSLIENGVLMAAGLIERSRIREALRQVAVGQSSAGITLALIGCVEIYCASWRNFLSQSSAKYSIAKDLNA